MVIPKDQAYFYTPEWQKEEQEASEDIKKERVTKTKNLKELLKKMDNPSVFEDVSKKFSKAAKEKETTLESLLKDLKKVRHKKF